MKTAGAKRIAERYVKALFDVAESASALSAVESDLRSLGRTLKESAEFREFLTNPLLTRQTQADIMSGLLAKIKAHKVTQQFIAALAHNRRLPILPEIVALFAQAAEQARGEMTAELIAASALKPAQAALVSERLSRVYGKKVNLDARQDASLLGGVVIKIGSTQIDGSIAGKLARLDKALRAA